MMTALDRWAAALVLIGLAACGSGAPPGGRDWSRVYSRSFDRVWAAALQTLADAGYYVEDADRARGRIRALSKANRSFEEVALDVRFVERDEDVRVDVLARGGAVGARSAGFKRLDDLVVEFLTDLDSKLE